MEIPLRSNVNLVYVFCVILFTLLSQKEGCLIKAVLPQLEPGKYQILYNLRIHKKTSLSSSRLKQYLHGGERVDVKRVKYLKYSVWGQVEDGWICMYMNQTYYVSVIPKGKVKNTLSKL